MDLSTWVACPSSPQANPCCLSNCVVLFVKYLLDCFEICLLCFPTEWFRPATLVPVRYVSRRELSVQKDISHGVLMCCEATLTASSLSLAEGAMLSLNNSGSTYSVSSVLNAVAIPAPSVSVLTGHCPIVSFFL